MGGRGHFGSFSSNSDPLDWRFSVELRKKCRRENEEIGYFRAEITPFDSQGVQILTFPLQELSLIGFLLDAECISLMFQMFFIRYFY